MKLWQIKRWFLGDVPPPWPLRSHKLNQKSIKIKPNRNIWVHSFNRMTLSSASFVTTTTTKISHWTLQIPTRYSLISEFLFVFCRFLRKLCCQFSATLNTSMPAPEKKCQTKPWMRRDEKQSYRKIFWSENTKWLSWVSLINVCWVLCFSHFFFLFSSFFVDVIDSINVKREPSLVRMLIN